MQGFTKGGGGGGGGGSSVAGVKKGRGSINSGARGCWKQGPFPLFSLFLPPRAPLALSRAQIPRSPSPFKASTQATFSELILAF